LNLMVISFGAAFYAFSSRSKLFLFGSRLNDPTGIRLVLLGLAQCLLHQGESCIS